MPTAKSTQPKTFEERDDWMRSVLASKLPHAAARLAVRIALHLNVDSGRCDPSSPTLAAESNVGERSVYRLIDLLEHQEWITVTRINGRVNQYTLLYPTTAKAMAGVTTAKAMAGVTTAKAMAGVTERPLPNFAPTTAKSTPPPLPNRGGTTANRVAVKKRKTDKRKQKEKSQTLPPDFAAPDSKQDAPANPDRKTFDNKNRDVKDFTAAFAEFWSAYPKRVAKEQARKAFAAAVKRGADPAALIAGAKRYAAERAGQDPKFTKHPATWINAECWLDEVAPTGPVIDEHGNPIDTPQPRPSRPQSIDEAVETVRARYPGNKWD